MGIYDDEASPVKRAASTFIEREFSIVIVAQMACEIDIRTLTSHRFWGHILGLRKDGRGGREYSFALLLGQKIQCTVLLGQKKVTLYLFFYYLEPTTKQVTR